MSSCFRYQFGVKVFNLARGENGLVDVGRRLDGWGGSGAGEKGNGGDGSEVMRLRWGKLSDRIVGE